MAKNNSTLGIRDGKEWEGTVKPSQCGGQRFESTYLQSHTSRRQLPGKAGTDLSWCWIFRQVNS